MKRVLLRLMTTPNNLPCFIDPNSIIAFGVKDPQSTIVTLTTGKELAIRDPPEVVMQRINQISMQQDSSIIPIKFDQ